MLLERERRIERLEAEAEALDREAELARDRLSELAAAAGKALEEYAAIRAEAEQARLEEREQRDRLDQAEEMLAAERLSLGRYAAAAYQSGGGLGDLAATASLLQSESPTELGRNAAILRWTGMRKSEVVDRVETAAETAQKSAAAAESARKRAVSAERRAAAARKRADRLVAEQAALVTELETVAAETRGAAEQAEGNLKAALRVAAERRHNAQYARTVAQLRGEVVLPPFTTPSGGCVGRDISGYPNGQIPHDALCPLWSAEWHVLRADAAAAFTAMSQDYARTFGTPICVTDSYRSFEMQVDVHRRKPDMTAVPGTSNHGWGLAVDLCDGIEDFGTAAHDWMQLHAPGYGWYHPSWAGPDGSRPEPWHWEYGG